MTKRFYSFLAFLLLLSLCSACIPITTTSTSSGSKGSASPLKGEAALNGAEAAYKQGRYREATSLYKAYLQSVPNPARKDAILAAYGFSAEKGALNDEAISAYERLRQEFPQSQFFADASVRLGALYLTANQPDKALSLANSLRSEINDPSRLNDIKLIAAKSQWMQRDYGQAAKNYLDVWQRSSGEIKSSAQEGLLASLPHLDNQQLIELQTQNGQSFPAPEATYMLIRKALEAGNTTTAMGQVQYFLKYFATTALAEKVDELAKTIAQPGLPIPPVPFGQNYDPRPPQQKYVEPEKQSGSAVNYSGVKGEVTIAALLPLSGNNASKYAQEVYNGLKLALDSRRSMGLSVSLVSYDTKGSPAEAGRMVKEAAAQSQIVALVGPFLSSESLEAAKEAQSSGIPLIAISQRPVITDAGPYVFRIFLTPKHQAEAVARYTVRVQNHSSLGVIFPDDAYGRSMRDYFTAEASRNGASVTVADSYDPKSRNWNDTVVRVTGGKAARKVSTSYQAATGFTSLYLPDSAGPVSQIVAQMAFHDVTKMQYLGTPLWLNNELLASSGRYLQGAVIPAPLTELSQRSETSSFIAAYQRAYGRAPDQFSAYGYDAGLAIISALEKGAGTRAEIQNALLNLHIEGATAPFGFDSNGEYRSEPALLTIDGQRFKLLRDAGAR